MEFRRFVGRILVVVAFAALAAAPAAASSGGIGGFSGNPGPPQFGATCNVCHSGGIVPTVTITGPTSVPIGMVATYTLTISGGQMNRGGLDVSATGGALAVNAGDSFTQLWSTTVGFDITHVAPRPTNANREVVFVFDWVAPMLPGSYTLYGAGNSVNNGQGSNGDAAATDQLTVSVTGATVSTPGETSGAGLSQMTVTGFDKATGQIDLDYGVACEATDNNIYFGDLAQVSSLTWSGETCSIGNTGSFGGFDPGNGSFFFVVVGTKSSDEGSYGLDRVGGAGGERASFVGNLCGQSQVLADRCD